MLPLAPAGEGRVGITPVEEADDDVLQQAIPASRPEWSDPTGVRRLRTDRTRVSAPRARGDTRRRAPILGRGGGESVDLAPLDAIRIAPAEHRTFAAGPGGLELLAFGTAHNPTLLDLLPAPTGREQIEAG